MNRSAQEIEARAKEEIGALEDAIAKLRDGRAQSRQRQAALEAERSRLVISARAERQTAAQERLSAVHHELEQLAREDRDDAEAIEHMEAQLPDLKVALALASFEEQRATLRAKVTARSKCERERRIVKLAQELEGELEELVHANRELRKEVNDFDLSLASAAQVMAESARHAPEAEALRALHGIARFAERVNENQELSERLQQRMVVMVHSLPKLKESMSSSRERFEWLLDRIDALASAVQHGLDHEPAAAVAQ